MGVRVREGEVYQLDILAIAGNKDIPRFQIPVNHLLEMHEAHSVENLAGYLVPKFCVPPAFREKQVKAVPVHPFHLQTNAKLRVIAERVVFSDIGMIEAVTDFILLTEHIPVERIVAKLRPDAF